MSMLWTSETAAGATGGKAQASWKASRVEIDSRRVQPGDLFVAIKGERFDGHAFAADALAKGASAAVVSRPLAGNHLLVPDTLKALEALGTFARARAAAKIVGVTGSVGKTSAKEMIRLALSAHGSVHATSGNYNNHIGTPLNLANLPENAAFGVFEMGMNHQGEIAHLTQMVRPHIAVITNVEAVHLEFFASVEKIADAKAEIFEGVEAGGIAVLNADNPHFARLKEAAEKRKLRVVACGEAESAAVRLLSYAPSAQGSRIKAAINGKDVDFSLRAVGRHWARTALLVLAVADALSLDLPKTLAALAAFEEPAGRGKCISIAAGGGAATLIDDSYNASPASMRAAFAKTREVWEGQGKKGRMVALLGDMLELGKESAALHAALAADVRATGFSRVYTAGALMNHLREALPAPLRAAHVAEAVSLFPILRKELQSADVVLVKGSHGSHMYELANALAAPDTKEKQNAL